MNALPGVSMKRDAISASVRWISTFRKEFYGQLSKRGGRARADGRMDRCIDEASANRGDFINMNIIFNNTDHKISNLAFSVSYCAEIMSTY